MQNILHYLVNFMSVKTSSYRKLVLESSLTNDSYHSIQTYKGMIAKKGMWF